jgi:predicted phage tail protein
MVPNMTPVTPPSRMISRKGFRDFGSEKLIIISMTSAQKIDAAIQSAKISAARLKLGTKSGYHATSL